MRARGQTGLAGLAVVHDHDHVERIEYVVRPFERFRVATADNGARSALLRAGLVFILKYEQIVERLRERYVNAMPNAKFICGF